MQVFLFYNWNKGKERSKFEYESSTETYVDRDAFIFNLIPSVLEDSYISLDNYLTQGYYAFGLALNLKHENTYGLGHNNFTTELYEKVFGKNSLKSKTYQYRLEENMGITILANGIQYMFGLLMT